MLNFNMTINGQSVTSSNLLSVINPATEEVFATCAIADKATVDSAVEAARKAFKSWSSMPDTERAAKVASIAGILEQNMPELMELVTKESGKPLGGLNGVGSGMEVGGSIAWTQATASFPLPVDIIQDDEVATVEVHRKALGVVASITPWNWPLMIAIWHVIPALRSGNTVVIKPASSTPVATLRFVELVQQVLPPGVLNIVIGGREVGHALASHQDINKVVFTGSTNVGKGIMREASSNLKRLTLELGGNDAGIVLPGSNVEKIIPKLFGASFHNNGHTCACLKRLYVHESQYEDICNGIAKLAKEVNVGNGLLDGTELGPIQNKAQLHSVKELIEDAVTHGATILAGGKEIEGQGYFHQPTVVTNISDGVRLVDEEQFGPVIPIIKYSDLDEVITRSNNNENGLGGSIWGDDLELAKSVALRMETGTVWINEHGALQPNAPFGGVKQSGFGVEFGTYGLEEYVSLQTIKMSK